MGGEWTDLEEAEAKIAQLVEALNGSDLDDERVVEPSEAAEVAIAALADLADRLGEDARPEARTLGARALQRRGSLLRDLWRDEEALACCESVVERFGQHDEIATQIEVAKALRIKGWVLLDKDRYEDVVTVCDEVVERFDRVDPSSEILADLVSRALIGKALAYHRLKDLKHCLAHYDELFARFEADDRQNSMEALHRAKINRIELLRDSFEHVAALEATDGFLAEIDSSESRVATAQIVDCLFNRAWALAMIARREEAKACYRMLLDRFGEVEDSKIFETIQTARMFELSNDIESLGLIEVIRKLNDLAEELASSGAPPARGLRSDILREQAVQMGNNGQGRASLEVFAVALELLEDSSRCDDADRRAMAHQALGNALLGLGRTSSAIGSFEDALFELDRRTDQMARFWRAQALVGIGAAHMRRSRPNEALVTFSQLVEEFSGAATALSELVLASSLEYSASALELLGRRGDAIEALIDVRERFSRSTHPQIREIVARSGLMLGRLQYSQGWGIEAEETWTWVVAEYIQDESLSVRGFALNAMINRAQTSTDLGRCEEALQLVEEAIKIIAAQEGHRFDHFVEPAMAQRHGAEKAMRGASRKMARPSTWFRSKS